MQINLQSRWKKKERKVLTTRRSWLASNKTWLNSNEWRKVKSSDLNASFRKNGSLEPISNKRWRKERVQLGQTRSLIAETRRSQCWRNHYWGTSSSTSNFSGNRLSTKRTCKASSTRSSCEVYPRSFIFLCVIEKHIYYHFKPAQDSKGSKQQQLTF